MGQHIQELFLLAPLQHEDFYVDPKIHIEMNRLKTITTWIPLIPQIIKLHNYHVINYTSFEYNFFTPTLQIHQSWS